MRNYTKHLITPLLFCAASVTTTDAQEYRQLTNLPTVYITTENSTPITSKEDYIRATLHYVDKDGITTYDALGIRGRGNSTWGLDKKPYRIKFDKKQEFLGPDRAKAKSWTLLANYADKTLMRNAVAACIGSFAGQPFTAAAQFADLVINGVYMGNYQISDQIEVRKKRVDITEQEDPMTDDSDISGGYLLEVDGFADGEPVHFSTTRGVKITVKSPNDEIIDSRQTNYIRTHINKFENALFSDNFTDPAEGYRQYVDSLSLASWYIASELTGNVDCFWSTYIYKERGDDHIYWGPLWDYDIAFNNCDRVGDVARELMINKGFGDDLTKLWIKRMWQDPWFVSLIDRTWTQMIKNGIEQHVLDYIDNVAAGIEQSQKLNFNKWPINKHVYNELVLFSTYAQGVEYLKNFISDHVTYLTDAFTKAAAGDPNAPVPSQIFAVDTSVYYLLSNIGSSLYADTDDGLKVVLNTRREDSATQQWMLEPSGDGWFRIINRASGLAITDVAEAYRGSYQIGSQLELKDVDLSDRAQQWKAEIVANGYKYSLVNRKTWLAWNNSNGDKTDGTPAISWTNNNENASKPTRQWKLTKGSPRKSDGISHVTATHDYMITYSPDTRTLRFLTPDGITPDGFWNICTISGKVVFNGIITSAKDLSSLSAGIYIISWQIGDTRNSVKLAIQ